jgi:hypothetical protein
MTRPQWSAAVVSAVFIVGAAAIAWSHPLAAALIIGMLGWWCIGLSMWLSTLEKAHRDTRSSVDILTYRVNHQAEPPPTETQPHVH